MFVTLLKETLTFNVNDKSFHACRIKWQLLIFFQKKSTLLELKMTVKHIMMLQKISV